LQKQELCPLSHISSPFCSGFFQDGVSWTICSGCLKLQSSWSQHHQIASITSSCFIELFILNVDSRWHDCISGFCLLNICKLFDFLLYNVHSTTTFFSSYIWEVNIITWILCVSEVKFNLIKYFACRNNVNLSNELNFLLKYIGILIVRRTPKWSVNDYISWATFIV
jgi:hypothetical protein